MFNACNFSISCHILRTVAGQLYFFKVGGRGGGAGCQNKDISFRFFQGETPILLFPIV